MWNALQSKEVSRIIYDRRWGRFDHEIFTFLRDFDAKQNAIIFRETIANRRTGEIRNQNDKLLIEKLILCHHLFGKICLVRAVEIQWTNTLWLCRQQKHTVFGFVFSLCFSSSSLLFATGAQGARAYIRMNACAKRRTDGVCVCATKSFSRSIIHSCVVCVRRYPLYISLLETHSERTHLLIESIWFFFSFPMNVKICFDSIYADGAVGDRQ